MNEKQADEMNKCLDRIAHALEGLHNISGRAEIRLLEEEEKDNQGEDD